MTEPSTHLTAEERIGNEFWTQPETALRDAAMQLIYSNLISVFREEIRENGGGIVDLMIAERASFMYAYNREREMSPNWSDRSRREMNKDLIDLLLTIKKLWATDAKNDAADRALAKAQKAIVSVLNEMPEEVGKKLQREFADAFEQHGI